MITFVLKKWKQLAQNFLNHFFLLILRKERTFENGM